MRNVVKCGRRVAENVEIAVEVLRNGDIGWNGASVACPVQKDRCLKRH
jgi:hypothetical protein